MTAALILAGGRSQRSGRIHKSCRRFPGGTKTWLDRQVLRLRRASFAPIILVAGLRPRRLWRCGHLRFRRLVNFRAAQGGAFSSLQRGLRATRSAVLVVQTDTPLPPVWELRRLRAALRSPGMAAAQLRDQYGHGGHPLMLARSLADRIARHPPSSRDARLDKILRAQPAEARSPVFVRRFVSYPPLNTRREWRRGMIRLRRWGRTI